jgi:hypothetical protein
MVLYVRSRRRAHVRGTSPLASLTACCIAALITERDGRATRGRVTVCRLVFLVLSARCQANRLGISTTWAMLRELQGGKLGDDAIALWEHWMSGVIRGWPRMRATTSL